MVLPQNVQNTKPKITPLKKMDSHKMRKSWLSTSKLLKGCVFNVYDLKNNLHLSLKSKDKFLLLQKYLESFAVA